MISTPLAERVCQIVATIFDVPLEQVTPGTAHGDLERWDSMGHLVLVLELEQEFGIQIPPEQVPDLTSVSEITRALTAGHAVQA